MRLLLIIMIGFIAACNEKGGSNSSAAPSQPSPAPVVWPPADALKTSDFSTYSCSILQDTSVACFDGTSVTELPPQYNQVADILVGDGIICTITDPNGAPAACTNLDDPACTHPPTGATVLCWTPANPTPIPLHVAEDFGYHTPNYENGALSLTLDTGYICVKESSFDSTTHNWVADVSKCGKQIFDNGVLE